jgi:hypothetical protein
MSAVDVAGRFASPARKRSRPEARRVGLRRPRRLPREQVEENPFLRRFYEEPGRHAFQMAEVAVPRELFGRLLDRIARLRPPDLAPC